MTDDPDQCRLGCWCRNDQPDLWPPPIGAMSWTAGDPVVRFPLVDEAREAAA